MAMTLFVKQSNRLKSDLPYAGQYPSYLDSLEDKAKTNQGFKVWLVLPRPPPDN